MTSDAKSPSAPLRRGRRPGSSGTRQVILDAARVRFAADGYADTTIRKIAADAAVDAALVMRSYRSKEELFAAAISIPSTVLTKIVEAFDGPAETLGERVTRTYLRLWEDDPAEFEPLLAMFRSAVSNERAAAQLREFLQARLLEGISPRLADQTDAALRAGLASSMLLGITVGRRILQVEVLANEDRENLVHLIAPAVQAILAPTV